MFYPSNQEYERLVCYAKSIDYHLAYDLLHDALIVSENLEEVKSKIHRQLNTYESTYFVDNTRQFTDNTCKDCNKIFPVAMFRLKKTLYKTYLCNQCIECERKSRIKYLENRENREKSKASKRIYNNSQKGKKAKHNWYKENRNEVIKNRRDYYLNNKNKWEYNYTEKEKIAKKKYYQKNKIIISLKMKIRYQKTLLPLNFKLIQQLEEFLKLEVSKNSL